MAPIRDPHDHRMGGLGAIRYGQSGPGQPQPYTPGMLDVTSRTAKLILAIPFALAATGCLLALPGGSGIRLALDHVPADKMPAHVPPLNEQVEDTVLSLGELAATGLSPLAGALLYQFGLRPLRRRQEARKAKQDA